MGFQHTNAQTRTPAHVARTHKTHKTHRIHTHKQCPHTHSSGAHTHSVRGCQNGESLKRVLLPCRSMEQKKLKCGFSIVLRGPGSAESDPVIRASSLDFERPERESRSPAGAQTCAVVYRRTPFVPRSREREKRPAARREKIKILHKNCTENYRYEVAGR